jgi:PST family polysaccharide transporter
MTGVWMIYTTKYWLHASLGRTDRMFLWGVVDFGVLSLATLVGLPFGPKGVAVAHVGAVFVLTVFGLRYAGKPIGLTFKAILSSIWRFFLAALASGILVFYFLSMMDQDWNRFIRLVLSSLIYTGVYFVFLVFLFNSFQPFTETYKIFKIFFSPGASIDEK